MGVIEANNYPDIIRLSYIVKDANGEFLSDLGDQDTVEKIVSNQNVACWTKCVKTGKVVEFSENTLMEDVVQHIKQLDSIETKKPECQAELERRRAIALDNIKNDRFEQ